MAEARSPGRRAIASAALAVALTVGVVHAGLVRGLGGVTAMSDVLGEDLAPGAQPAEAGAFLRETGLEGATVNFRRWSGYLLWSAWPKIHVLYDPRVNLTPEVWRLEGAAHDLRTRPAALAEAHGRYGVELAIFGAPAFVDAPPAGDGPWELVFKAGPEEIYQHREGAHAEENRRRIATWLAAHGGDARRGGAAGARSLGERVWAVAGARWRAATWQRRRAREAAALVEDPRASDPARAAAHRALGRLAYGARDLTSARRELTESLALLPTDAATAYELGLVELADGHGDAARPWLVRAGRAARLRPDALPPEDLRRLELLGERWRGDPRAPRGR